jgi:selenide,water dikinase
MPQVEHPDLLEGFRNFSDAGVFRLREDLAIVQSVDFFPPIVDDPDSFGRIAAANSLSDVYAMGGKPVTALCVVGFPESKLDVSTLGKILAGGAEKAGEAGAIVLGGHSVSDSEVKFGLAVTGVVNPAELIRNSGARAGDVLVLTKPLGTGAISTAGRARKAPEEVLQGAIRSMATLNRHASEAMRAAGAHGATDITGFGLLGHAREMAEASGVTLSLEAARIPLLPGARELARKKLLSGGAARSRRFLGTRVSLDSSIPEDLASLLYDAETSGGLLLALPREGAEGFIQELHRKGHTDTARIGEVLPRGGHMVVVRL